MSTLDAIRDDLSKIVDQAMWAHGIGYSKPGRGLDAERGADLSRTEEEREKGGTRQIEIGDKRCRVAYRRAVRAVTKADHAAALMLVQQGVTFQLKVVPLTDYSFPTDLRRTAVRLRWRLDRIEEKQHKAELADIHTLFDKAIRGLARALDHGSTVVYTAHRDNPCRTCGIRQRRPKGIECKTCETWRFRHEGKTRPVSLDHDSVNEARAAQVRRMARDEGWGVA